MAYCDWSRSEMEAQAYHDEIWGTPVHDDRIMFEYLSFEVMQCGLSFLLVWKKRKILESCFASFDYEKVSKFTSEDVRRILQTEGMIRSEAKIRALISNAGCFMKIREKYGSFSSYLWSYSDNKMILYEGHEKGDIPASNRLSEKISKDLKKEGFSFLGPVVVYSHLQACGIINDHDEHCPRREYLISHYPTVIKKRYGEKGRHQF